MVDASESNSERDKMDENQDFDREFRNRVKQEMESELVGVESPFAIQPYGSGIIGILDPRYAKYIGTEKTKSSSSRVTRVSDMYISSYGILGYAEYNVVGEELGGVVEVPKKLTLLLQLASEKVYKQFKEEFFGSYDLEKHIEDLEIPQLAGAKFMDEVYYYGFCRDFSSVGCNMIDEIRDVEERVKDFLQKTDEFVNSLRRIKTDPKEQYNRLMLQGLLP